MVGITHLDAIVKNSVAETLVFDDSTMLYKDIAQRKFLIAINQREFEYLSNDFGMVLVVVRQPQCFFILSNLLRKEFDHAKLHEVQVALYHQTWYAVNEALEP